MISFGTYLATIARTGRFWSQEDDLSGAWFPLGCILLSKFGPTVHHRLIRHQQVRDVTVFVFKKSSRAEKPIMQISRTSPNLFEQGQTCFDCYKHVQTKWIRKCSRVEINSKVIDAYQDKLLSTGNHHHIINRREWPLWGKKQCQQNDDWWLFFIVFHRIPNNIENWLSKYPKPIIIVQYNITNFDWLLLMNEAYGWLASQSNFEAIIH